MMLVQSIFIICSLVLWNQCTSYSLRHEIFEDEKAVEGVKLTKLSDIKEESSIEELKVAKLSKTNDELSFLHFSMFGKPYSFKLVPANSIFSQDFKILHSKQQDGDFENYQPLQKSEQLEGSFYTDENGKVGRTVCAASRFGPQFRHNVDTVPVELGRNPSMESWGSHCSE
uniref:Peptidase M12B propeptide domain-containing protein n=1 Tax=Strigamia maritima TaxID=126957 RepID=T1J946_STRMM